MVRIIPVLIGQQFESKCCGKFEVIDIHPKWKIKVRFLSTGYETISQKSHVVRGNVRDHYLPSKFGVGYLGEMAAKTRVNKKPRQSYVVWHNMLVRCYDPNYHKICPTYKDCEVCDEWKNYHTFHLWFEENYIEGYHLDKDKLVKGNKIYSPSTCVFLPPDENLRISSVRKNSVYVKDSEGQIFEVTNSTEFCGQQKIHLANFNRMITGHRRMAGGFTLCQDT